MNGGSILKHTLSTGVVDVYQVTGIHIGATGEIGVVKMHMLTRKNTVDGQPEGISVPSNMISAMIDAGILESFNRESR